MKKLLSLTLALLYLCGALVGCQPSNAGAPEDSESASESESDAPERELVIAADGETEFSIWIDSGIYSDVKSEADALCSQIYTKTGATLPVSTDRYFTEADDAKPAILIGNTKSASTYKLDTPLKLGDFIIGMDGNKILIGNTSRTTAEPEANGYTVSASDGKLQIFFDGMVGFENLKNYLLYDLFKADVAAEYTISEGFSANDGGTVKLDNGTHFVTNRTGDMRYMVYNVYGYGEGATVTGFATLCSETTVFGSDHSPLIMDFELSSGGN